MKESEIIVSLSMSDFNTLKEFKNKYNNLVKELKECADIKNIDASFKSITTINFDAVKAFQLCKKYLPNRLKDANFIINVD